MANNQKSLRYEKANHGGGFWQAVGNKFEYLERLEQEVISADVHDAWFMPSPKVIKKISENLPYVIKTSPPTNCRGLVETISQHRKIPEQNIITASGSSDLIYLLLFNTVSSPDRVLILDPMYEEYAHIAEKVVGAKLFRHKLKPENDFEIQYKDLLADIMKINPQMIILVNPNSPTGKYWERGQILKLLGCVSKKIKILIDETYIEYVGGNKSLEGFTSEYENLVVIKSMSKVYALSGLRVGYLVANKDFVNEKSRRVPPWAVSLPGQIGAIEALKDNKYYQRMYKKTHILRDEMVGALSLVPGIRVYNSTTNFFLIELKNEKLKAQDIVDKLKKEKIYIRNCDSMSNWFKNNFLRVAVKNRQTNMRVIREIKALIIKD